jgi:hypothetical protein
VEGLEIVEGKYSGSQACPEPKRDYFTARTKTPFWPMRFWLCAFDFIGLSLQRKEQAR